MTVLRFSVRESPILDVLLYENLTQADRYNEKKVLKRMVFSQLIVFMPILTKISPRFIVTGSFRSLKIYPDHTAKLIKLANAELEIVSFSHTGSLFEIDTI
jgi:hypothetical protein